MIKKNILIIVKTLGQGGISKYVEQTYLFLNKEDKFDISFLILSENNDKTAIDVLKKSGMKIFTIPAINKSPISYFKKINTFLTNSTFDVIHWHTDNWINVFPILLAMKKKVNKVIVQSHNSSNSDVTNSKIKRLIQSFFRNKSQDWNITKVAVSEEASGWMFGSSKKVKILLNPVDIKKFRFNKINRSIIRKKYGITDEILFGNVGRFKEQKNQLFLIDIFNQICKLNNNSKLMLIGSGPLERAIDKKIEKYNLQNKVIKVKWTKSIDKFYSAFDEIISPSLYEGFPLALIEAQCAGCPVIFSDTITSKAKIIDSTVSCSLEEDSRIWAKNALNNIKGKENERMNAYNTLLNKEFDYNSYIKKMIALYL